MPQRSFKVQFHLFLLQDSLSENLYWAISQGTWFQWLNHYVIPRYSGFLTHFYVFFNLYSIFSTRFCCISTLFVYTCYHNVINCVHGKGLLILSVPVEPAHNCQQFNPIISSSSPPRCPSHTFPSPLSTHTPTRLCEEAFFLLLFFFCRLPFLSFFWLS
jgi:hypothetical protein